MVIVDSREKRWDHIREWFDKNKIPYVVQKLDEGDYQIKGNSSVSVDRKRNLSELSKNLLNAKDHSRFWKEVRRARGKKMRLVVLCEHGGKIKSIQDVALWSDKYSGVTGRRLMDEIYRVHIAYGVEFLFCSKRQTAKKIIDILSTQ